jgi:signal transduction histidine kinase
MQDAGLCEEMIKGQVQSLEHFRPCSMLPSMGEVLQAGRKQVWVSIPLLNQDELIGAFCLAVDEPGALSEEHLEITREVANSLAIAIHHARLHSEVERHAAELEARNRELDAYAHTVAHDIKDPLGLVIGFAEVLERDYAILPADEIAQYLHIIWRSGVKMNSIVDELLLLARVRRQEVQVAPLDMAVIVSQARQRLAHIIADSDAQVSIPDTWPVAQGYGPWVEEVWVNLLSNAIKYGGKPPLVQLGATELEDQVRFWVRDNGDGIHPEDQTRLFLPFTRLDQARAQGHGLGLSTVRSVMAKLGGQVWVESEGLAGRGSVFTFALPRAIETADHQEP